MKPLSGTRVVDLSTSLAGPFCAQILGGLGADVIKLERTAGDDARTWKPPAYRDVGALYLAANGGKRSIALDIRRGAGIVRKLIATADVVVESFRPGRAEELGLSASDLQREHPRLVWCSIGAYGRLGPRNRHPGYDPLMQAHCGIMSVTGVRDGPPVRVGVSLIDQTTGLWGALGIVSALRARDESGVGSIVDVALFETALTFMSHHLLGYLGSNVVPRPAGTSFSGIAPYEVFSASDGNLMVAAATDRMFVSLVEVLGVPELAGDARFATNSDRVLCRVELSALLAERVATWTRGDLLERLASVSVPAAPVLDVAEVIADEQTSASGMLREVDGLPLVLPPLSLDQERLAYERRPPEVGEHTVEILRELGLSDQETRELLASGLVAAAAPQTP